MKILGIGPAVCLLALTAAVAGCGGDSGAAPRAPTVYAASSLRDALPALDRRARYSFAGSGQLQRQIAAGAPADLLLAASPKEPRALFAAGRCERPVAFATNRLVMLMPRDRRPLSLAQLARGGRRIAVGSDTVPVGAYTRRLLQTAGYGAILARNTVSAEPDVASIVAKVALGSADAGFAYATDGRTARRRARTVDLPAGVQPPIRYLGCVVRRAGANTAPARAYLDRLRGDAGRAVLKRFGFGLP